MKYQGRKPQGPNEEILVIPRPSFERPKVDNQGQPVYRTGDDGQPLTGAEQETEVVSGDLVFKARAILDYSEFEALCPEPQPPMIRKRGETVDRPDLDDLKFKQAKQRYARQRTFWLVIKSLEATPDLEWEQVKLNDPDTWPKYETELREAGLTDQEVARIIQMVIGVNGLDDEKYEQAKKAFLAGQGVRQSN
jgi:hypothetical protein